jgi:MGT family glycosyltransferase
VSADGATVVFFPEGAYGPTNNCVGIGDVLRRRGSRVVFVVEESFAGTLEAKGFEERLMRLGPPPEHEEAPGQFWKDYIRETAPIFRKPTIEQLSGFIQPTWQALIDGAKYVDERLAEIFDDVEPDVIVEDNVVCFPAILASGRPWVRTVSCNPLELKDSALPPVFSGYAAEDRTGWEEFREEYRRTHMDMHADFDAFVQERGAPPLPPLEFIHESEFLNLYLYPAEADYGRAEPLAPTWHRLDSCVRTTDEAYELPDAVRGGSGKVLYLSLGSLGSADTELMQRLIDVLGETEHGVVVSMGPQHEELTLASNMVGAEFLPQTSLLPQVDLVLTHGGNNTITESFFFGKPRVVLPLFWDQYDNAQRVDELGFGFRLPTYAFADEDLTGAIDRLLADDALNAKLAGIAARLQGVPGTVKAADLIERVARDRAPVAA